MKISPWNEKNRLLTLDDVYTIYETCGFKNVRDIIKINDSIKKVGLETNLTDDKMNECLNNDKTQDEILKSSINL